MIINWNEYKKNQKDEFFSVLEFNDEAQFVVYLLYTTVTTWKSTRNPILNNQKQMEELVSRASDTLYQLMDISLDNIVLAIKTLVFGLAQGEIR